MAKQLILPNRENGVFIGGTHYDGETPDGARAAHITLFDDDTSVEIKLTQDQTIQIISQLASTLKNY